MRNLFLAFLFVPVVVLGSPRIHHRCVITDLQNVAPADEQHGIRMNAALTIFTEANGRHAVDIDTNQLRFENGDRIFPHVTTSVGRSTWEFARRVSDRAYTINVRKTGNAPFSGEIFRWMSGGERPTFGALPIALLSCQQ